jgi:hypothetical protein
VESSGYNLPLDGTDEERALAAITLAKKLHQEVGLLPGVAVMAATAQVGADPEVVYDCVLQVAFRVLGKEA